MKRVALPCFFLAVCALTAWASDFGLALSAAPKYGNANGFELTAKATPWFSALVGDRGGLFFSADFYLETEEGEARFQFDMGRFEYRLVTASGAALDFGRFSVADPSGVVVSGLLDGVRLELPIADSSLRVGAYYTGLFNKYENYLCMSAADMGDLDTFFSSSRVLAAAAYERKNLFGEQDLAVEALAQFDLRSEGDRLHTQYLVAGLSGPVVPGLSYKAYGIASLVEETDKDPVLTGAASLDMTWLPPGEAADRVYGQVRWASGQKSDTEGSPFLPVTANPQGAIFDPRLAGLLAVRGGYAVRLSGKVSLDASAGTFLKMGEGRPFTYNGLAATPTSAWLGAEAFASARYMPASDLALSLGAGIFVPNAGGAFDAGTDPSYLVSASVLISL